MRNKLVELLDFIGVNRFIDRPTAAGLWSKDQRSISLTRLRRSRRRVSKRANENQAQFQARINKLADDPDSDPVADNDGWIFGRNWRDVGSLHIDELRCPASDLARRNLLAVHPVAGWWKPKSVLSRIRCAP